MMKLHQVKLRLSSSLYEECLPALIPKVQNSPKSLFIMGSGRNGSSLLAAILNNHPKICIPPESGVIPFAIKYWYKHPFSSWEAKLNKTFSFLERPSLWSKDFSSLKQNLLTATPENKNLVYLVDRIYTVFAEEQEKSNVIWGDKTPANTIWIKMIKKQFPSAKIIFLFRDPRDFMASMQKLNPVKIQEKLDFLIWTWKNSLQKFKFLSRRHPEDVKLLKYEDLVTSPRKQVDDIIQWLNLEKMPDITDNFQENIEFLGIKNLQHHLNLEKPINPDSIGNWKAMLESNLANKITRRLSSEMKILGYD